MLSTGLIGWLCAWEQLNDWRMGSQAFEMRAWSQERDRSVRAETNPIGRQDGDPGQRLPEEGDRSPSNTQKVLCYRPWVNRSRTPHAYI